MPLRHAPFEGVGVALVTLFDRAGELDAAATGAHAARLVDAGVRGVLVAGTTGEAATLDPDERDRLVAGVRDALDGRAPVVAGTGAPSTRQAVHLSRRAADAGADALLVLPPPGCEDPRPYFDAVVAAVPGTPVLAYHFPPSSAPGIPLDALAELPVAGLKDSTGDPVRLAVEADLLGTGLYTGSAAILLQARAMGASGAIVALANVDPGGCIQAWDGDGGCQRELVNGHRAGAGSGIVGIKRAMADLYGTSRATRIG